MTHDPSIIQELKRFINEQVDLAQFQRISIQFLLIKDPFTTTTSLNILVKPSSLGPRNLGIASSA